MRAFPRTALGTTSGYCLSDGTGIREWRRRASWPGRLPRDASHGFWSSMSQRAGFSSRPRIGLDPFGEGIRVILPAVGDAPDGVALWRVTADGTPDIVQSRALWVGTAEAAPETTYPLSRP